MIKKQFHLTTIMLMLFLMGCGPGLKEIQPSDPSPKSVIIIGAGIAGLSAGSYAQMNGYQATIYEMHDKPGGLCTSWHRDGYTIDGCLHWLIGSGPGINLYNIWQELGAVQGRKMIDHEEFVRIQSPEGKTLIVYTNIDRLEKHLLALSPQDRRLIKKLTKALRIFAEETPKMSAFDPPMGKPPELAGFRNIPKFMKMSRMGPLLMKWSRISFQDFATQFKDPFLRKAFPMTFSTQPDLSMAAFIMVLATSHIKTAGYPIGGSLAFSESIAGRFQNIGGKVQYNSRVAKILVKDDQAIGVRLEDGTEHYSDIVISAADGHATIFKMLEGKYLNKKIQGYYDHMPKFKSKIYVALGIDRDLSTEPHYTNYMLAQPIVIGSEQRNFMNVRITSFDPTLAPKGKTMIISMLDADYYYWKELDKDRSRYEAEKDKIANTIIQFLEKVYPGISAQVEMVDVATAMTFERYTGNWEGSIQGWLATPKSVLSFPRQTLPGLENFYMAGQWCYPGGGVPTAAVWGRNAIQLLCHKDKKDFVTTIP